MKKIYTLGLALCLITACSSEQESVSPNEEQNTNVQDDNIRLADAMNGSYDTALIDEYKDSEKVREQIALFGEDLEQFLKVLEETTLIREPLPDDRSSYLKEHHQIMLMGDGSRDIVTFYIEEENGEQLVSLPTNDIIPSGVRKATNTDILKAIEAIKALEE
jgi:hypothetical protein